MTSTTRATEAAETGQATELTRRTVLTGAAWSAPVIVLATAVPAHAASTAPAPLAITPGGTAVEVADVDDVPYFDLVVAALSVTVPGTALAPGELTLTATFVPSAEGAPTGLMVYGKPDGWDISPATGESDTVVIAYGGAVGTGDEVPLPDGDYFGTGAPAAQQSGMFTLTASAPGHVSDTVSFATGPAPTRRARRGGARYQRPQPS